MLEYMRQFAESYGLTNSTTLWVLFFSGFSAILAAREFFVWYFKLHRLDQRLVSISEQLVRLENELQALKAHRAPPPDAEREGRMNLAGPRPGDEDKAVPTTEPRQPDPLAAQFPISH